MIDARDLYERYRFRERERAPDNARETFVEIARFTAADPRFYDPDLIRKLEAQGKLQVDERVPYAFLTYSGRFAAAKLRARDMVVQRLDRRYLEHDLAVHKLYRETKTALEKDGAEVVGIRTEAEFRLELGHATGRTNNARTAVQEFAEKHDLHVINARLCVPDVRIIYELDYQILHRDLEIASGHRTSAGNKAHRAAGMLVADRNAL